MTAKPPPTAHRATHVVPDAGSRMPGSLAVSRPTDHTSLVQGVRKPVIASAATR
jgi:hypothetical protein